MLWNPRQADQWLLMLRPLLGPTLPPRTGGGLGLELSSIDWVAAESVLHAARVADVEHADPVDRCVKFPSPAAPLRSYFGQLEMGDISRKTKAGIKNTLFRINR